MECGLFYKVCQSLSGQIFEQGLEGNEEASRKGIWVWWAAPRAIPDDLHLLVHALGGPLSLSVTYWLLRNRIRQIRKIQLLRLDHQKMVTSGWGILPSLFVLEEGSCHVVREPSDERVRGLPTTTWMSLNTDPPSEPQLSLQIRWQLLFTARLNLPRAPEPKAPS